MTVLTGIAALAMATCVGYYFGRRAASTPSTWKKRTSRVALGRQVLSLLVLLTARRIRRSQRSQWVLRPVAPLGLLRARP